MLRWNDKFKLLDGSYFVSHFQDYFEYIIKKHETVTENSQMRSYVNRTENRITCKIVKSETMELLGSNKNNIIKDKNGENVPHLEITETVLVHCNIVSSDYQHDSRVLNISFGQLSDISPKNFIFIKSFNSEFSYIEEWLND